MTKFLQKTFSVNAPGTEQYRNNWETTFGSKPSAADRTVDMFTGKTRLEAVGEEPHSDCELCDELYCESQKSDLISRKALLADIAEMLVEPLDIHEEVREFHKIYEQPILDTPQVPPLDRVKLRIRLITEEFCELLESCGMELTATYVRTEVDDRLAGYDNEDREDVYLTGVADALADLAYVIEGTNLEFGIPARAVSREVHRSNKSKLGADGKPVKNETGKITKGPNYSPPDIEGVLRDHGWNG